MILYSIISHAKNHNLSSKEIPSSGSKEEEFQFDRTSFDDLARMEHNRYCAERWIAGWKYGPIKDYTKKENDTLILYDNLDWKETEKDVWAAKQMKKTLGMLNLELKK